MIVPACSQLRLLPLCFSYGNKREKLQEKCNHHCLDVKRLSVQNSSDPARCLLAHVSFVTQAKSTKYQIAHVSFVTQAKSIKYQISASEEHLNLSDSPSATESADGSSGLQLLALLHQLLQDGGFLLSKLPILGLLTGCFPFTCLLKLSVSLCIEGLQFLQARHWN